MALLTHRIEAIGYRFLCLTSPAGHREKKAPMTLALRRIERCTHSWRRCLGRLALVTVLLSAISGLAIAQSSDDQIVLTRPWARLRSQPSESSRAVAIVYGNDVLKVLERKDGWIKVRGGAKAAGWLSPQDAADAGSAPPVAAPQPGGGRSTSAVLPPLPPAAGNPANADTLRQMGYAEAARRKLTDILLAERDTPGAYRATRDMLMYHPVGDLPPLEGTTIPPELRDQAHTLRTSVLLQEAQQLVTEGKPWDAVLLYQSMVQGEPDNGRAYLELLDLLTRVMQESAQSPNMDNLGLAVSIYRKLYPDLSLPPAVQARLNEKK